MYVVFYGHFSIVLENFLSLLLSILFSTESYKFWTSQGTFVL